MWQQKRATCHDEWIKVFCSAAKLVCWVKNRGSWPIRIKQALGRVGSFWEGLCPAGSIWAWLVQRLLYLTGKTCIIVKDSLSPLLWKWNWQNPAKGFFSPLTLVFLRLNFSSFSHMRKKVNHVQCATPRSLIWLFLHSLWGEPFFLSLSLLLPLLILFFFSVLGRALESLEYLKAFLLLRAVND